MNSNLNQSLADHMRNFRMPLYNQLPDMGLYLEQTVKYINQCLAPLSGCEITGSMVRNYVKMDLVANPEQKQYFADQIAHLIVITVLKTVLSLDHIQKLFTMQQATYSVPVAFDYFCMELENLILFRFGVTDMVQDIGVTSSREKEMLRSAITAVSHIIYLRACFDRIGGEY